MGFISLLRYLLTECRATFTVPQKGVDVSDVVIGHHHLLPMLLLLPLPVELLPHHPLVVALVVVPQLLPVLPRPVDLLPAGRDVAGDGREEPAPPELIPRQAVGLAARVREREPADSLVQQKWLPSSSSAVAAAAAVMLLPLRSAAAAGRRLDLDGHPIGRERRRLPGRPVGQVRQPGRVVVVGRGFHPAASRRPGGREKKKKKKEWQRRAPL